MPALLGAIVWATFTFILLFAFNLPLHIKQGALTHHTRFDVIAFRNDMAHYLDLRNTFCEHSSTSHKFARHVTFILCIPTKTDRCLYKMLSVAWAFKLVSAIS